MRARIAGREFDLDLGTVERALLGVAPASIRDHFVVVGGESYPVKQALAVATGLDPADFQSHQARAVLLRLGFEVSRVGASEVRAPAREAVVPYGATASDAPTSQRRWVAMTEAGEVVCENDDPHEVVAELRRLGRRDAAIFGVGGPGYESWMVGFS